MKIIKIEGCMGCPHAREFWNPKVEEESFCFKTLERLDLTWSVNPSYIHPDCPLEEEEK